MKKPYKEGDWFAVPVGSNYVLGRIARVGRRGGVLIGYFFMPLRASVPTPEDTVDLTPEDAFHIGQFGDLGLVKDGWPLVYHPDYWSRAEWPMPFFGRIDDFILGRGYCSLYDEDELTLCLGEWPITVEEALQLPQDVLSGHIALQNKLELFFEESPRFYDATDRTRVHLWLHGLPTIDFKEVLISLQLKSKAMS